MITTITFGDMVTYLLFAFITGFATCGFLTVYLSLRRRKAAWNRQRPTAG